MQLKFGILQDIRSRGLWVRAAGSASDLHRRISEEDPPVNFSAQTLTRDLVNRFCPTMISHLNPQSILFVPRCSVKDNGSHVYMDLNTALNFLRGPKSMIVVSGMWPHLSKTVLREYQILIHEPVEVARWAEETTLIAFNSAKNMRGIIQNVKITDLSSNGADIVEFSKAVLDAASSMNVVEEADSIDRGVAWARQLGLGKIGDAVWVAIPRDVLFSSQQPKCSWAPVSLNSIRPKLPIASKSMKIDAAASSEHCPLDYVRYYFTDTYGRVVAKSFGPEEKDELTWHSGGEEAVVRAIVGGAAVWALDSGGKKSRNCKRYYTGSWESLAAIVTKSVPKEKYGLSAYIGGPGDQKYEDLRGHAYEIVLGERMTAIYMDIDGYLNTNPEYVDENKREALVWAVIRTHLRFLRQVYGDDLPADLNESDYHIYDSTSQDADISNGKMSFHIILKRVFFANNVIQAAFMNEFHRFLVQKAQCVRKNPSKVTEADRDAMMIVGHGKDGSTDSLIDFSVYKTAGIGQLWRGYLCSKAPEQPFGSTRTLRVAEFNRAPFENDTLAGKVLTSMVQRPPYANYSKIDFIAGIPQSTVLDAPAPEKNAFMTDGKHKNTSKKRKAAVSVRSEIDLAQKSATRQKTSRYLNATEYDKEIIRQFLLDWKSARLWRKTLSHANGCTVKISEEQPPFIIIDLAGKNQPCLLRVWAEKIGKKPGKSGAGIHSNAKVEFFIRYDRQKQKWLVVQSCKGQCAGSLRAARHTHRAVLGDVPASVIDKIAPGWRDMI